MVVEEQEEHVEEVEVVEEVKSLDLATSHIVVVDNGDTKFGSVELDFVIVLSGEFGDEMKLIDGIDDDNGVCGDLEVVEDKEVIDVDGDNSVVLDDNDGDDS
ncbi:hypothetical protein G210_1313 [Candida maltosa Xu316]|uniref:Uncharacterized protein n=1 Tax=Candida maltosa (strain Xu316) TaxID=1245528 RepID=M3HL98_CANMX|nr:hypothetical protein G210_1313 [Candida maltosa Xu316]